jgi:hypothetical protein
MEENTSQVTQRKLPAKLNAGKSHGFMKWKVTIRFSCFLCTEWIALAPVEKPILFKTSIAVVGILQKSCFRSVHAPLSHSDASDVGEWERIIVKSFYTMSHNRLQFHALQLSIIQRLFENIRSYFSEIGQCCWDKLRVLWFMYYLMPISAVIVHNQWRLRSEWCNTPYRSPRTGVVLDGKTPRIVQQRA